MKTKLSDGTQVHCLRKPEAKMLDHHVEGYLQHGIEIHDNDIVFDIGANIGVFGVDTGTPILNPGEVGIVALGSIRPKPWVVNNEIQIRQVTTIGATFDHRVVDGDVASRFVQDVASVMEEPALLLD